MNETLNRSMVLFDAAGLAAALTAATVYSTKQDDVTFVMPAAKTSRNSLQFNWPKIERKAGEHQIHHVQSRRTQIRTGSSMVL